MSFVHCRRLRTAGKPTTSHVQRACTRTYQHDRRATTLISASTGLMVGCLPSYLQLGILLHAAASEAMTAPGRPRGFASHSLRFRSVTRSDRAVSRRETRRRMDRTTDVYMTYGPYTLYSCSRLSFWTRRENGSVYRPLYVSCLGVTVRRQV